MEYVTGRNKNEWKILKLHVNFLTRNSKASPHQHIVHSDRNKVTCLFKEHIQQIKRKNTVAVSDFLFILLIFYTKSSLLNILITNLCLTCTHVNSCDMSHVMQDAETYVKYSA